MCVIRLLLCPARGTTLAPGIVNDFGMMVNPTAMDVITLWQREQEVVVQTGKPGNLPTLVGASCG